MFRTPSGQTGHDAYVYAAAQIANRQRALDRMLTELVETIASESPADFERITPALKPGSCTAECVLKHLLLQA